MSTVDMVSKIEQLKELEALVREAEKEVESLKDEIKAEMTKQNTEELEAGRYIVRWTNVITERFDSKALKNEMGELYNRFVKTTESRRFSIVG